MVGIPSSGKTTRALELEQYFKEEHKQNVVVINEEFLKMDKNQSYKSKKMAKSVFCDIKKVWMMRKWQDLNWDQTAKNTWTKIQS